MQDTCGMPVISGVLGQAKKEIRPWQGDVYMTIIKKEDNPVVVGSQYDFWLHMEDDIYDEKYGEE